MASSLSVWGCGWWGRRSPASAITCVCVKWSWNTTIYSQEPERKCRIWWKSRIYASTIVLICDESTRLDRLHRLKLTDLYRLYMEQYLAPGKTTNMIFKEQSSREKHFKQFFICRNGLLGIKNKKNSEERFNHLHSNRDENISLTSCKFTAIFPYHCFQLNGHLS